MSQLHLWYRQTSQDPAERAYAFAAAGLLTAGNWDARNDRLEDRLDAIIQAAGGNPLHWKLPAASVFQHLPVVHERELAGAWRHGFAHSAAQHKAARLIVDMQSFTQAGRRPSAMAGIMAVSRMLAAPTIERRTRMQYLDDLQAGDIASVAFAGFPQALSHDWSWPLRVGVWPQGARAKVDPFEQVRAAERGLLDMQSAEPGRQDLFVITNPTLKAMGALHESPLGLGLVRTPLTARSRLMRQWLSDDYSAPVAFFDVRPEFTGQFLTDFTYEMAHNNPLDVAVFGAYAQAWQRERAAGYQLDIAPPVLLAPMEEPGGVFEDSRIGTRVDELISRLGRLPGMSSWKRRYTMRPRSASR